MKLKCIDGERIYLRNTERGVSLIEQMLLLKKSSRGVREVYRGNGRQT